MVNSKETTEWGDATAESVWYEMKRELNDLESVSSFNVMDASDLGNAVGIALGRFTAEDVDIFLAGFKHGVSLSNGTHG